MVIGGRKVTGVTEVTTVTVDTKVTDTKVTDGGEKTRSGAPERGCLA